MNMIGEIVLKNYFPLHYIRDSVCDIRSPFLIYYFKRFEDMII